MIWRPFCIFFPSFFLLFSLLLFPPFSLLSLRFPSLLFFLNRNPWIRPHGNQVSAHGLGKSPKQVVEMSRRGVTTERQRKMRTKTHSQNSTNFGCTNVLFLVQKQSYAPSIRIIIDESTRQFNMIFDRASFDAVSFLYNLIRFNTIFRTIFRVCCMFRFSTLQ